MSDTILVYTTFTEKEEALKLCRILLEKHLIACVQIDSSVDSLYWWNGKIEQEKEHRLVMKSNLSLWEELQLEITKHHSYDVPEILAVPVSAISKEYEKWMHGVLENE
jgi:periplasmic divalent cation tolerance protein